MNGSGEMGGKMDDEDLTIIPKDGYIVEGVVHGRGHSVRTRQRLARCSWHGLNLI